MTNQAAGENPLKVFGAMLAYYRTRVGMTPEQLGARVYLSGYTNPQGGGGHQDSD
jgi:hypothetical protein